MTTPYFWHNLPEIGNDSLDRVSYAAANYLLHHVFRRHHVECPNLWQDYFRTAIYPDLQPLAVQQTRSEPTCRDQAYDVIGRSLVASLSRRQSLEFKEHTGKKYAYAAKIVFPCGMIALLKYRERLWTIVTLYYPSSARYENRPEQRWIRSVEVLLRYGKTSISDGVYSDVSQIQTSNQGRSEDRHFEVDLRENFGYSTRDGLYRHSHVPAWNTQQQVCKMPLTEPFPLKPRRPNPIGGGN